MSPARATHGTANTPTHHISHAPGPTHQEAPARHSFPSTVATQLKCLGQACARRNCTSTHTHRASQIRHSIHRPGQQRHSALTAPNHVAAHASISKLEGNGTPHHNSFLRVTWPATHRLCKAKRAHPIIQVRQWSTTQIFHAGIEVVHTLSTLKGNIKCLSNT